MGAFACCRYAAYYLAPPSPCTHAATHVPQPKGHVALDRFNSLHMRNKMELGAKHGKLRKQKKRSYTVRQDNLPKASTRRSKHPSLDGA